MGEPSMAPWGRVLGNGPRKRALVGQFASALEHGELWTEDGSHVAGRVPVSALSEVWNVSPHVAQISGPLGVFDTYHGYNENAQFPALWGLDSRIHDNMSAEPSLDSSETESRPPTKVVTSWYSPNHSLNPLYVAAHNGRVHTCDGSRSEYLVQCAFR